MHTRRIVSAVVLLALVCSSLALAQYDMTVRMPLIGEKAPAFTARTTQGSVSFPDDYKGKWVILFSHPADFTPVCTTEFMTFSKAYPDFKALNCELIGLSIDSIYAHIAWLRTITDKAEYKDMKDITVPFPLIEDIKMDVARKYGMMQPSASTTQAVRAVFFIDPEATIRAILYYPLSNGRNVEEIRRLLLAMETSDQYKVATPANWVPTEEVIMPTPGSCGVANQRVATANEQGLRCVDWFLCFKPSPLKQGELPNGLGPNQGQPPATNPAPATGGK
jgi:peroxiredoxin 2/4